MVTPAIHRFSVRPKVRSWKCLLGAFPVLFLLLSGTGDVQAQEPVQHVYTARLIRSEGVNPFKPMLADVLNWLPEAEITLEREEDVLHIRTQGELSPVEMRAHLEPYGIQLAAFLKDGVPLAGTVDEGKTLPWLSDLERGAELGPEEIAARKDAWVLDHPEEYLRLLNSAPTTPEPR